MSIKIQIISDLHLEFMTTLPDFLNKDFIKAEYLFLAGDIGYPNYPEYNSGLFYEFICWCCNNYKKIFFVMGNHESYTNDIENIKKSLRHISSEKSNFIFLEAGIISELENYKVIGCTLWSIVEREAFNYMNDSKEIKYKSENIKRENILQFHREDKQWIKNNVDSNTIVMTHHLPSYNLVHNDFYNFDFERINSAYASHSDMLIDKAKLWIFGHTHRKSDIILNKTRCICNPHGYIFNDDYKKTGFTTECFII